MKIYLLELENETRAVFTCPGCNENHGPRVKGVRPWEWNGSLDTPTLRPSILVTWEGVDSPEGNTLVTKKVCHSFVTDGRIEFLADCTHSLAGQTVDLPPCNWNE